MEAKKHMTISDMLTSISNTKKAIKSAVVSKGVSIEDNIPFSEYANKFRLFRLEVQLHKKN